MNSECQETMFFQRHFRAIQEGFTVLEIMAGRAPMQQWEHFPLYLSQTVWQKVMDEKANSVTVLDVVFKHLWALGLKNPSEFTKAVLTCLLVIRDEKQKRDCASLRLSYLNCKSQLQSKIEKFPRTQPAPLVPVELRPLELPADPSEVSAEFRAAAFVPDGLPVEPMLSLDEILRLAGEVNLRSNNASTRSVVAAAPLTVDQLQIQLMQQQQMNYQLLQMQMLQQRSPRAGGANLTIFPPKEKPLETMLNRALTNSSGLGSSSSRLCLEDQKQVSSSLPATPATVTPANTHGSHQVSAVDLAVEKNEKTFEECHSQKQGDAVRRLDFGEAVASPKQKGQPSVSLADSMARLQAARADGPVKAPAEESTHPASARKRPASAVVKASPKKAKPVTSKDDSTPSRICKRPAAALKRPAGSKDAERKALLSKIPAAVRKQFANGCSKCRYTTCTPSCWRGRGYF
eukprot:s891_g22.t1